MIDSNAAVTNAVPSFDGGDSVSRTVAENSASVGSALGVTDSDDSSFAFSIIGGAAHLFDIDNSGQLTTANSGGLDYESGDSFSLIVGVSDQKDDDGLADTAIDDYIAVTINVTDDNTEAPGKPDAPALYPGVTQIVAVWDPPTNNGPEVSDYKVEYQENVGGATALTLTESDAEATITGLTSGTEYLVKVQATNDEGTSAWSDTATVTTKTENSSPVFVQGAGQDLYIGRTWQPGRDVGSTIKALDVDGDTFTFSLSDDDGGGNFIIDVGTGQLQTNGEVSGNNDITVVATDGQGASSAINLRTIAVPTPGLPTDYQLAIPEESITDTSFVVRFKGWVGAAPDWIDIRFREKDSGDAWTVREKVPTFGWEGGYDALRVTGLKPETTYEIHLRGAKAGQVVTGPWSDIVALSPDYRKIPYPTTLEWRTPVTISFSARSYAGTHGSAKLDSLVTRPV